MSSKSIRALPFRPIDPVDDRLGCFLPDLAVMKSADPRQSANFRTERRPNFDGSTFGCISETRADAIDVVVDVVTEDPAKVVLAYDDDVIDGFAFAGSNPSLRGAVLPRAPECCSIRVDADPLRITARKLGSPSNSATSRSHAWRWCSLIRCHPPDRDSNGSMSSCRRDLQPRPGATGIRGALQTYTTIFEGAPTLPRRHM